MSSLAPKQYGLVELVGDMATGGPVVLANATNSEQLRAVVISQTTAGQTITLPNPLDTSVVMSIDVHNDGSAAFTMYGVTLTTDAMARFGWNGAMWVPDVAPTAGGPTREILTATAQNVLPSLAVAPIAGTVVKFYINGKHEVAGISSSAAGVITVVPATLGYNIETVDEVVVEYYS